MTSSIPGVTLLDVVREDAVATVLRARDDATGEAIAVRRLHRDLARQEAPRLVFQEEHRRVATLKHPLLLRVLRGDVRAEVPWYATDPVDGETLADDVARAPWPEARATAFVRDLASAFALLAARKQVHVAPLPARFVRVGAAFRLATFRDVRAEDEAKALKGREPTDPAWVAPETSSDHASPCRGTTYAAWWFGALWRFVRTGAPPSAAPPVASTCEPGEPRAWARLLDREPLRRPAGAPAWLALLDPSAPSSTVSSGSSGSSGS